MLGLRFFSRILLAPPEADLLRPILQERLWQDLRAWACFACPPGGAEEFDPQAAIDRLNAAYTAPASASTSLPPLEDGTLDALLLELRLDHLALFSGPTPKAAPWESVWRERDKLLFGEQTEKVRQAYLDWNLDTEASGREPEDHLGLEMAFALFLLQAVSQNPPPRSRRGLTPEAALAVFLDAHILAWAGPCLQTAGQNAATVFYRETAPLCLLLLRNLRRELD
jgi:TorA maturation chaperone TorD